VHFFWTEDDPLVSRDKQWRGKKNNKIASSTFGLLVWLLLWLPLQAAGAAFHRKKFFKKYLYLEGEYIMHYYA